ncbi:protein TolB [Actinomycetota bacterium Odt1-20B]
MAADGAQADGRSGAATLSPDGDHIGFASEATNLTPDGGQRPRAHGYVRDLRTGQVTRIRESMSAPVLSADGRYAAHTAWGPYIINVFLTDLTTGERKQVDGKGFKEGSYAPSISADGRYIAYQLTPRHPENPTRVEVYDRVTDTREVVSDGPPDSSRDMTDPSISADGSRVAYVDEGADQVWVRDRTSGALTRVDDGMPSTLTQLSADGRTVAMNSADGAYIRDLRTGKTHRFPGRRAAALSPDGHQLLLSDAESILRLTNVHSGRDTVVGHGSATAGAVGAKGRSVVFSSADTDVVPGDTNGVEDVFLWHAR